MLKYGRLRIQFEDSRTGGDEAGIDSGGLSKEWYQLVSRELMNPKYALFVARDDATLTIDTRSSITPDHLAWFEFLGTLMARALCDCHLVHAPLCAFLFKHILNRSESIGMADLRQVDPVCCVDAMDG